MVFSELLYRLPYSAIWHILRFLKRPQPIIVYCPELIDYYSISPVLKHLGDTLIVTMNPAVMALLKQKPIPYTGLPAYPKAVIMCRHATHKFPCHSIIKIGMRHGPYHFKRMTRAGNYNQFDLYLFSSQADLSAAEAIGVHCGKAIGFPRLDPAFDGSIGQSELDDLKDKLMLDANKAVLLFSATWDKSGMSAVQTWCNRLGNLTPHYNVLVTLHPWTQKNIVDRIAYTPGVHLIREANLLPYIALADVCVGDTSSLLAEFCALGKPIITFKTDKAKRSLDEIDELISMMSIRISSFNELENAIRRLISNPELLKEQQMTANHIMFDHLDGKAAERAAAEIIKLIPELAPCS